MEWPHAPGGFNVKQSEDDAGGVAGKYFQDNRWEVINENDGDDFRRRNRQCSSDERVTDKRVVQDLSKGKYARTSKG